MNLYRVVPKDAKGFINWKIGWHATNLFKKYHLGSVKEAIDAYIQDFHEDPFDFMLSLDSFVLLTWEVTSENSAFAKGILVSIDRLDEI